MVAKHRASLLVCLIAIGLTGCGDDRASSTTSTQDAPRRYTNAQVVDKTELMLIGDSGRRPIVVIGSCFAILDVHYTQPVDPSQTGESGDVVYLTNPPGTVAVAMTTQQAEKPGCTDVFQGELDKLP